MSTNGRTVSARGYNITACCVVARRLLNVKLKDSREVLRSYCGNGLWRVTLMNGDIVECTMTRARVEAHLL